MPRPITEKRKQIIEDNIAYVERILCVMKAIRDGESETNACCKYDIDKKAVRDYIARPRLGYTSSVKDIDLTNIKTRHDIVNLFASWQEKLYEAVCGLNENSINVIDMPPDVNESIETVMQQLNEREQKILIMHYKNGEDYQDIADDFGVSRERIKQLENRALKKMRKPQLFNKLKYGIHNHKKIRKYIADARKANYEKMLEDIKMQGIDVKKFENDDAIGNLPLSQRTRNACIRSHFEYISDFVGKSENEMLRTRGLGELGYRELVNALAPYGIKFEKIEKKKRRNNYD